MNNKKFAKKALTVHRRETSLWLDIIFHSFIFEIAPTGLDSTFLRQHSAKI